jgi:hypothetical protein
VEVDLAVGVVDGTLRVFGSFCMVVASAGREAGFPAPRQGSREARRIGPG